MVRVSKDWKLDGVNKISGFADLNVNFKVIPGADKRADNMKIIFIRQFYQQLRVKMSS